ncbi:hypothetical protein MCEMAEM4_02523 [Burkholderiaceae bacterium]
MNKDSLDIDKKKSIKDKIKDEFNADKKFFIRLLVSFLLLVIAYYLFSPYQNCLRIDENEFWCMKNTRW